MKQAHLIALLCACTMLIACGETIHTEDDIQAITALHDQWKSAMEDVDVDAVLMLWSDDGILMEPNALPYFGKEGVRTQMQFFNTVSLDDMSVVVEELEVAGEWAFLRQTFKGTWKPRDGRAPYDENSKEIMVLKKQPDHTWRIARYIWNANPVSSPD